MLLLFVMAAVAQDPRSVAQQIFRAHVGTGAMPQDITILGQQTDFQGRVQPIRVWIKGKDKARYEVGSGRELRTTVYNSGSAWVERDGKTVRLQTHTAIQRPSLLPFLDLIADSDKPEMEFVDRGSASLGQFVARRMTLRLRDSLAAQREFRRALDEEGDVYFDPPTLLVVRTEQSRIPENNADTRIPTSLDFSDYRAVQGVLIPFRIVSTTRIPGLAARQTTYIWQSVTVNQGVSDSLFLPR